MIRLLSLTVAVQLLAAQPGLAQFGGGQGPVRVGGGMQGMGGMGGMGAGMGGFQANFPSRTVQVQTQSGKKVAGKLQLGPVVVAGELGHYTIKPEFVKIIRFASKNHGQNGENEEEEKKPQPDVEAVITNTGEEIRGQIQRQNWVLEIDCGTLTLEPENLRSMTFLPPPPSEPKEGKLGSAPETKPSALKVTTVEGPGAVGLMVSGPRITRIAAAAEISGDWIPMDLKEPVAGLAVPVVAAGVVVYGMGRHIYAFGSEAKRWDVLDLPEGVRAAPSVGPGTARVEYDGQIHEFSGKTGKWSHINVRSILDTPADRALKALRNPDSGQ